MNKKHGLKIKHRLEDMGSSFSAVGRKLKPPVTPQSVFQVAYLVRSSQRIVEQLAKDTGWPESKIFPTRKAA